MPAGPERTVRLDGDVGPPAGLEQRPSVLKWAELHLVDRGRAGGSGEQSLQFAHVEVGDTDRTGIAELAGPLHTRPGPGRTASGPVDEVQVQVVEAEALEALFRLGGGILSGGMELRGDVDIVTGYAAVEERPADALLVAAGLGRVDMPVPEIEGPLHGIDALRPVGHLPDAESEHWHPGAVSEHAGPAVTCGRIGCHRCLHGSTWSNVSTGHVAVAQMGGAGCPGCG